MRKAGFLLLMLIVMLAIPAGQAAAQQQQTQIAPDVTLALGLKFWFNTWQSANGSYGPQQGTNVQSYTSDSNVAFIPSISLKIKDFLISTSFLAAPEYKFPKFTDTIILNPGTPSATAYTLNHDITAKRTESDTNIGWYVSRNIALTLGYKVVSQEITDKRTGTGLATRTQIDKPTYAGPTAGFSANVPVGNGWGMYGNLAFGSLDMKYQGGTTTYKSDYVSTEFGFGYKDRDIPLSFTLGYRFQSIDQKLPSYQVGGPGTPVSPDVTKGFTLGLNFIF